MHSFIYMNFFSYCQNKMNQAKFASCVTSRAPRCWGDACRPLRHSWRGCSAPGSRWWTTIAARPWQPRWTPRSCAWGASRWTSEPCPLYSSRRRAETKSRCLVPVALRGRRWRSEMEAVVLWERGCWSVQDVVAWSNWIKVSLCD